MTIQINQEFPHCARCGLMLHYSQGRFGARDAGGVELALCSELCRDEYAELNGYGTEPVWVEGRMTGEGAVA